IIIPTTRAAATKASQPKTAVFQWLALQRPILAARLFECFRGDISISFGLGWRARRNLAATPFRGCAAGRHLEVGKTAHGWCGLRGLPGDPWGRASARPDTAGGECDPGLPYRR